MHLTPLKNDNWNGGFIALKMILSNFKANIRVSNVLQHVVPSEWVKREVSQQDIYNGRILKEI